MISKLIEIDVSENEFKAALEKVEKNKRRYKKLLYWSLTPSVVYFLLFFSWLLGNSIDFKMFFVTVVFFQLAQLFTVLKFYVEEKLS